LSPIKQEIKPFIVLKTIWEGDFTFIFQHRNPFQPLLNRRQTPCRDPQKINIGENIPGKEGFPQLSCRLRLVNQIIRAALCLLYQRSKAAFPATPFVISVRNKQQIKQVVQSQKTTKVYLQRGETPI